MDISDWLALTQDWETKLQDDEWFFVRLRESYVASRSVHEAWGDLAPVGRRLLTETTPWLKGELGNLMLNLAARSDTTELPADLEGEFPAIIRDLRKAGFERQADDLCRWFRR